MRRLLYAFIWFIFMTVPAFAQEVSVGDQIVLVERDIHIPAHPDAGDPRVSFRFVGGSSARVLAIDAATGWVQILGANVAGGEGEGWIVKRYIASRGEGNGDHDAPLSLSWCPPKGSPAPHPSGRLRIATWNLENLHALDGQSTFTGSDPSVKRFAIDYERIKCYVRLFDPDILAVQEVDGEAALRRVVDTEVYDIVASQRPKPHFMNGKQNTGFAYKKGLNVEPQPDFEALDIDQGSLRRGARINLGRNGQTFQLMSVHLKSGCFHNSQRGSACTKLFRQVPVLEQWIDQVAAGPDHLIVLGDFNRRFTQPGDLVWSDLDDANPADADLTTVTEHMPISCRDNRFTEFIDHIVFGKRAMAFVDRASFRHLTYRQADKAVWDKISDHCPVIIELWVP